MSEVKPMSGLKCPLILDSKDVSYSLVDYRNSYFTSENPDKIIDFYDSFRNRDDLIEWMKERPKGVANIYEVDGDKEIIVVIPTADFNGKYAKECRENIFRGLHIIFVESGGRGDFYFNIAHNVNLGVKKAMEYDPKWVVFSGDDMYKIDKVMTLKEQLRTLNNEAVDVVFTKPSNYHSAPERMAEKNILFDLFYGITNEDAGREIIKLSKKYDIKYFLCPASGIFSRLFKKGYEFAEIQSFGIFSAEWVRKVNCNILDETFINAGEDTDLSLRFSLDRSRVAFIDYRIGGIIGGTLGIGVERGLRSIAGLCYLNFKCSQKVERFIEEGKHRGDEIR